SKAGYSGNFLLNALSYSAMLVALSLIDPSKIRSTPAPGGKLLDSVREGLQYIRRDAVLPSVLTAYGALLFFGPSSTLVLPLFVKQILHRGSAELGLLFSAVGRGTVVSALALASLGDFPARALIEWLGLRVAVLLGAAVVGTIVLTLFAIRPAVRTI